MRKPNQKPFGTVLRDLRLETDVSLGRLAAHLGFSVPYMSDVENNRRNPLTPEKIIKAADLLRVDVNQLLEAAATTRKLKALEASRLPDEELAFHAALMRSNLTQQQMSRILKIAEEGDDE